MSTIDGLPICGKGGGLTIAKIDTNQKFYGQCIRRNKGDSEAMLMSWETWDILNHFSRSLEEKISKTYGLPKWSR